MNTGEIIFTIDVRNMLLEEVTKEVVDAILSCYGNGLSCTQESASCLNSCRQQIFIQVNVRTISVRVVFPSRILCSPGSCCRRSEGISSSLLLPEVLDRWAVVSARGIVVEGIAKRAIRGVSQSCRGGEGTRGGGLEWLNYFRGLPQPHEF